MTNNCRLGTHTRLDLTISCEGWLAVTVRRATAMSVGVEWPGHLDVSQRAIRAVVNVY